MTAAALRRLGPQDRKAARALLRPAFTRYAHALGREPSPEGYRGLDRALDPASGRAWGFEADGRLLAGAFVEFRDGGAWELERLAALPEATGRGFGARLLHHVEAEARAMHAPRIALVTASRLTGLVRLYAAHGYQVTRRGPPDHGLDAHERSFMALELGSAANGAPGQTVQS